MATASRWVSIVRWPHTRKDLNPFRLTLFRLQLLHEYFWPDWFLTGRAFLSGGQGFGSDSDSDRRNYLMIVRFGL